MLNEKTHGALVIFVKTPGISPLKLRLAKTLGTTAAETFHALSAGATEAVAREAQRESPELFITYWAVAENDGMNNALWRNFTTVPQGEGSFGECLHRVYTNLLALHKFVLIAFADSPQLAPDDLTRAAELASNPESIVLGPTEDGGFYLLGGSKNIPLEIWNAVPYGSPDTFKVMDLLMSHFGRTVILPKQYDVDTVDDLQSLEMDFASKLHQLGQDSLLPEQILVFNWVRNVTVQYGMH